MKLNYIFKALLQLTIILFCLTKKTSIKESTVRPYATYLFKLFGVANGGKLSIDYSIGESSDSVVLHLAVSENTDNLFYSGTLDYYNYFNNATLCMMKNGKECFCSSSLYELNLALNKNCVIMLS